MKYTEEANSPAITQEVLLSEEGKGVIITYPHFSLFPFFTYVSTLFFFPSHPPSFVSVSSFAVMINKNAKLCQFIYSLGGGELCLSKSFFPLISGEGKAESCLPVFIQAGRGSFFFFFCGSMLFVSVTIDGVIPFHSVVWLCPIMPACSVSACSPLGQQEGDCWARRSSFSH